MKNCDKVSIRCNYCGDVLVPDGFGSFLVCSCGRCAVDGRFDEDGEGYVRLIGNKDDYRVLRDSVD